MSSVSYPNFSQRTGGQSEYTECEVIVPITNILVDPKPSSILETQLLLGQRIDVKLKGTDRRWLQCRTFYGVEAYIEADTISSVPNTATHRLRCTTLIYQTREVRSPVLGKLHANSLVRSDDGNDDFVPFLDGWILRANLIPVDEEGPDPVNVAEKCEGDPYKWGGVTEEGFDCSGLMIHAFASIGERLPHSAAMIAEAVAGQRRDATPTSLGHVRRGDLICWRTHIGIMRDPNLLIHATAHGRRVCVESLKGALYRRLTKGDDLPSHIIRPSCFRR